LWPRRHPRTGSARAFQAQSEQVALWRRPVYRPECLPGDGSKAYLLFCLLLLLSFIAHGRHLSVSGFISIVVILLFSFMLSCLCYANFSKQLVDYDIDSFISDRSYNSSLPVKFPDFSTIETHPDVSFAKTRIGAFLRRTCIRFAMLEKLSA
jgi:hypothetical protein